MPSIWIIGRDPLGLRTLTPQLAALGAVSSGPPELAHFREAPLPDLIVLPAPAGGPASFEELLGFLASIVHSRREPAPVLWIDPPEGGPGLRWLESRIDDRPLERIAWTLGGLELQNAARELLARSTPPPSLRDRARRNWVADELDRRYGELDLSSLRSAIDPRRVDRPVLLIGEDGTARRLVARAIHDLSEPPRSLLLLLSAGLLEPGRVEETLLARSAGRRTTVYLKELERASAAVQEELAHLLGEAGLRGVESLRFVASASRLVRLAAPLAQLPWLQVKLPPLRERSDLRGLADAVAQAWAERTGRSGVQISEEVHAALAAYGWPGNLREFEAVLEAGLAGCASGTLKPEDLRLGPAPLEPKETAPRRPEPRSPDPPGLEPELGSLEAAVEETLEQVQSEPESPVPEAETAAHRATPSADHRAALDPGLALSLAAEIRPTLRKLRTQGALLSQQPEDRTTRALLETLLEEELPFAETTLSLLEHFASFGTPSSEPVDLAALLYQELERRQSQMRARELVVLEELERGAHPAMVDRAQRSFAIGALLDRALKMIPPGGDLQVGNFQQGARHRVLIRFHSPEEVLVPPPGLPGASLPLEVLLARAAIERMGGRFSADASGANDNLILLELPAAETTR